jgi:hypothetical protein
MSTRTGRTAVGLTAVAQPSSGPAPGAFHVHATGGVPPYTVAPMPSPPNPDPMPGTTITGMHVDIDDAAPPETTLYFRVRDAVGNSVTVSYTVDP